MGSSIRWLTVKSAAEWLGVTEQTIRNWINEGIFPAYQINPRGRGRILIKEEDIVAAMEKRHIVPK